MLLNYQPRPDDATIKYIVIHTNQGPHIPNQHPDHTAENLATYLTSTTYTPYPVSYHTIVDDDSLIVYLADDMEAWAALSSNPIGLHLCFIGMAEWSRDEWLQHTSMLQLGATKVAQWCQLHNIPIQKSTPPQVSKGQIGIIGHADWTYAQKLINPNATDSHTDPGNNFPWDIFIPMIDNASKADTANMIDNFSIPPGKDTFLIGCPNGSASAITKASWVSAFLKGPTKSGTVKFWFQNDSSGISASSSDLTFKDGHSTRFVKFVPDGTTMIRVDYDFPEGGVITLEVQPK